MDGHAEGTTAPELDPFRPRPKSIQSKTLNRIAPVIAGSLLRQFQKRDIVAAERFGERLLAFAMRVDGKHRRRALSNLEMAFPDWSLEKREETVREMYRHFGRVIADFTHTPQRSLQDVLDNTEVEGFEHLEAAESLGKGVIAITAHFGNWEWMGHWMTATGRHLAVIARDANQGTIQQMLHDIRAASGVEVLSRGNAARGSLTWLKKNNFIGILPDQNARDIYIPFFGKTAGTVIGPAVFYNKTGSPVLPCFGVWIGPGQYRMIIRPALTPVEGFEPVEGMMRAINNALEEVIRQYPQQWLWMHDRWKSARVTGQL